MLSLTFFLYAIVHLAIWFWGWWVWNRVGRPVALTIVQFGNTLLWYDNFRIGIGRYIGEGDLLYNLSVPSFAWHWGLLPLFIIVAGSIARLADLQWARNRLIMGAFCLLAVGLIILELPYTLGVVFGDLGPIKAIELAPACIADTLRYSTSVSTAQACFPGGEYANVGPGPKVAIIMNFIMVVIGVMLWVKHGWKWLAVGPGLMFVAAATGPVWGVYALPVANFGEVLFTLGVVITIVHFARLKHAGGGQPIDIWPLPPAHRPARAQAG